MIKHGLDEILEDKLNEGIEKGRIAIARKMIELGKSVEEIVEITGLTVDDVLRLESEGL